MKPIILACILLLLISLACGASAPSAKTAEDYVREFGGSVDVYQKILTLTDCSLLQNEFDVADENNQRETPGTPGHKQTLGYMTAADDRMKVVDCYGGSGSSPPTVDLNQIIAQTSNAAIALTQTASSPTPFFTSTFLPTLTKPATIPPIETAFPTATVIFVLPTQPPGGSGSGICSCSGDNLNCSDFPDHSSAQACFQFCVQQGAGDINKLDQDNDGDACEAN